MSRLSRWTFRQCAEQYVADNRATWKNAKHRAQWDSTLATYAMPILGDLSVAAIDTPLVLKVIEPIWKAKPETAGRVRGRIETILDAAKARGYRQGENPARWVGHLDQILVLYAGELEPHDTLTVALARGVS